MMEEIWGKILADVDVRQNLSALRKAVRENPGGEAFAARILEAREKLLELLNHTDAKTRKNAALLLGELGGQGFLKPLYEAYEKEEQLFVKSSYLTAIRNLDYREYLDSFKARLEELTGKVKDTETVKHVREEMKALTELLVTMQGVKPHPFTGWQEEYEVVLLTNRNFQHLTLEQLRQLEPRVKAKVFGAGMMAKVPDLSWIRQIRTYQELLFAIPGMKTGPLDAEEAAEVICQSKLLPFLTGTHQGDGPFYFRVELKSRMEPDRKSAFLKRLTVAIEENSYRSLINSTSHYELELRLIENREGSFNMLLKLYTLADQRFTYRQEVTSTSMRPVNAALTVALVKDYLKEGGQVLDPFCGVGTLLIERHKAVTAASTYGVDRQEEAVAKARINTDKAGQLIHYINRDFFEFRHEYLFDEIITDPPFASGSVRQSEVKAVYERFFEKAKKVLKPDGLIFLYSHDRGLVRGMAPSKGYRIREEFEISMKEGTYVYVLSDAGERGQ